MLSGLLTTLLLIDCIVLMILIIALQHGNEGGIGSAFGSGNSTGFFGASGGVSLIVRATWVAGILFFGIATTLSWVKTHEHFGVGREIDSLLGSESGTKPSAPKADTSKQTAPVAPATAAKP